MMQISSYPDAPQFCPKLEVTSVNEGGESVKNKTAETGDQICEASTSESRDYPTLFGSIIPQLEAALKLAQLKLAKCEEFTQVEADDILRPIKERVKQLYEAAEAKVTKLEADNKQLVTVNKHLMQYIDRSLKKEHDMQIQITLSFEEGKLVVFIGQCIGFFAAKPYVTLNARLAGLSKTMSFKTAIVKDTNPTFDEKFAIPVAITSLNDLILEFKLLDHNRMLKDELIGWFIIDSKQEQEDGVGHWSDFMRAPARQCTRWHQLQLKAQRPPKSIRQAMTTGPRRRNFAVRNEAIRSVDPKRKLFVNDGYEKNTDED